MGRFLLLFLSCFCTVIANTNDTLNKEVPLNTDQAIEDVEENVLNASVNEMIDVAVAAYLEEDWDGCIEGFTRALHGYKTYKRMVTNCRTKCRREAAGSTPIFKENIEDLHFYEKKVRETLCLMRCTKNYQAIVGSEALKRPDPEIEEKLMEFRPYEYLHICYFKKGRNQDAASSVYTFLVKNPNHEPSIESLKYYLSMPDVDGSKVVNFEAAPYLTVYFKGVAAYEAENYEEAVTVFENSLRSYMEAEEECRFYCEGPFNHGWYPEQAASIANHFAYCLKCKRTCSMKLINVNGEYRRDLLRSHYNYLQYSYYKLGNLKAACAAVESYLLFAPKDESMLHNKAYYAAQANVHEEYFTPREEAVSYMKRQDYEKKILKYISTEFKAISKKGQKSESKIQNKEKVDENNESTRLVQQPLPNDSSSSEEAGVAESKQEHPEILDEKKEIIQGWNTERSKMKIGMYLLIAEGKELGGENRYVADGFLNETGCQALMRLAFAGTVEGDGYSEHKSPHSKYERFEGVTIGRLALMVYYGQIEPESLELLLDSTESVREHVERYFKLDRHLYFTYTHLVCRTAIPDSPAGRDDLSHEIHADNCILLGDTCFRENPAYVWRDYSAILYLNNDFHGGEFIFAKVAMATVPTTTAKAIETAKATETAKEIKREVQATVIPDCGRIVAFSAGGENLHGVQGVRKGRRCALALWFTLDEKYAEYERTLAKIILKRVRLAGPIQRKGVFIPLKYEEMLFASFEEDELLNSLLKSSSSF